MKISTIVTLWLLGVNASAVSAQYTMLRLRGSTTTLQLAKDDEENSHGIETRVVRYRPICNDISCIQQEFPRLSMFPVPSAVQTETP